MNKIILATIALAAALALFGCVGGGQKPVNESLASLEVPALGVGGGANLGDPEGLQMGFVNMPDSPVETVAVPSISTAELVPTVTAEELAAGIQPSVPAPATAPTSTAAPTGTATVDCSQFATVPSCSYVPAEYQAACRQCYPNK